MPADYLHNHKQFPELIRIVAKQKIIDRFSEDIDIHIDPPADRNVKTGRNQDKPAHIKSRRDFYDWLANTKIKIDGIHKVERDTVFDSEKLFSGGIRLRYQSLTTP